MRNVPPIIGLAVAVFFLTAACSDTTCETYGKKVCELACGCTEDERCVVTNAAGDVVSVFADRDACHASYVGSKGCEGGGDPFFDFEGCLEAVKGGTCVEVVVDDETGEKALALEHPVCGADAGAQ